jgi:hypothetical protein
MNQQQYETTAGENDMEPEPTGPASKLTVESLWAISGFENFSREQAAETITNIRELAGILVRMVS